MREQMMRGSLESVDDVVCRRRIGGKVAKSACCGYL